MSGQVEAGKKKNRRRKKKGKTIEQKKREVAAIKKQIEAIEEKINELRTTPALAPALACMKKLKPSGNHDPMLSANATILQLDKEVALLKEWHKKTPKGERCFAVEHVAGIIGEGYKVSRAAYRFHINRKFNKTVSEALNETVVARNSLLMHSPFVDESETLSNILGESTIPSYNDIHSLGRLVHQQVRNIVDNSDEWNIDAWMSFGDSHARLTNHAKAIESYKQALLLFDRYEEEKKSLLENNPTARVIEKDKEWFETTGGWSKPITQFFGYGNTEDPSLRDETRPTIVLVDDPNVKRKKYHLHSQIGMCLYQQGKFGEAIQTFLEAYDQFIKNNLAGHEKFQYDGLVNFIACLGQLKDKRIDKYFPEIVKLLKSNSRFTDGIALLQCHYATYLFKINDKHAQDILDKIDINGVESEYIKIHVRLSAYRIRYSTLPDGSDAFKLLLNDVEQLLKDLKTSKAKLIEENGAHDIREIEKHIDRLAQFTAKAYTALLSNEIINKPGQKTGKDLQPLQKCLQIQEKYNLGTRTTHFNIGLIYYAMSNTTKGRVRKQHLETAVNHYLKTLGLGGANTKFVAYRQLAFAYEDLKQVEKAIRYASLAFSMLDKCEHIPDDVTELTGCMEVCLGGRLPKDNYSLIKALIEENPKQALCLIDAYKKLLAKQPRTHDRKQQQALVLMNTRLAELAQQAKKQKAQAMPDKELLKSSAMLYKPAPTKKKGKKKGKLPAASKSNPNPLGKGS